MNWLLWKYFDVIVLVKERKDPCIFKSKPLCKGKFERILSIKLNYVEKASNILNYWSRYKLLKFWNLANLHHFICLYLLLERCVRNYIASLHVCHFGKNALIFNCLISFGDRQYTGVREVYEQDFILGA